MVSKKIYLIRHGQTDYNLKNIVQGSGIDAPLNSTGIAQSEAFYQQYGALPFDRVYTSVLRRSLESVGRFIEKGIPHTAMQELNEIHWGESEGKEVTISDHRYYKHITGEWRKGNTNLPIAGGESPEDVSKRQQPALKKILEQDDELILVCMHGRAMKILLCGMMGLGLSQMDEFDHANLCLYKLNYSGNFDIELYNDTSHLNGLG